MSATHMDGRRPSGDIDYVIMASANDEDRLVELLESFRKEYPEIERAAAIDLLKARLGQLLSDGRVGIYESVIGRTYTRASEYRDLSLHEALALVESPGIWGRDPARDAEAVFCLFAKDPTYWGRYYGEEEKA